MQGINKEIQAKVESECKIKRALKSAKDTYNDKKVYCRREIERRHEVRELQKLEQDWIDEVEL
jgi:hypothetical protein